MWIEFSGRLFFLFYLSFGDFCFGFYFFRVNFGVRFCFIFKLVYCILGLGFLVVSFCFFDFIFVYLGEILYVSFWVFKD